MPVLESIVGSSQSSPKTAPISNGLARPLGSESGVISEMITPYSVLPPSSLVLSLTLALALGIWL